MLEHPTHAGVQEEGSWALKALAEHPDNQAAIVEAEGIEAILLGMDQHVQHSGVQLLGCGALMALAEGNERRICEAAGRALLPSQNILHSDASPTFITHLAPTRRHGTDRGSSHAGAGVSAVLAAMDAHPKHAGSALL